MEYIKKSNKYCKSIIKKDYSNNDIEKFLIF